jgi:anti-anti-sigma factor
MGRFELIVLTGYGKRDRREPARLVPGIGPSRSPATVQIEQTVIWAESRQISITGELDLTGADALQHLLADTVGSGLPCIVLDLSTCRFLDAGVLGVITEMHLQLAANGQELVVHGATGQVERLIQLAKTISPGAVG